MPPHSTGGDDHGVRHASLAARVGAAGAIGLAFAALTWYLLAARGPTVQGVDFSYPWLGAQALLHHTSPYDIPSAAFPLGGRFFYPLTAALVALPFAAWPAWVGGVVSVGLTAGLCAFAVTRRGEWWRLAMFASGPALLVCYSVQWGALFAFALLTPWAIGIAGAIKPHIALALLAGQRSWRCLIAPVTIGCISLAIAFAIRPHWPFEWLRVLHESPSTATFRSPLFTAWGLPIWLAATRWRDPDARLLLFFAAAPQTNFFYDQLPLLLIARSRKELFAFVVCTLIAVARSVCHSLRSHECVDTDPRVPATGHARRLLPRARVGSETPPIACETG